MDSLQEVKFLYPYLNINNKIYIIAELYCGHIHGSFIDCLDTYYNLKLRGYDCDLVILVHLQYVKPLIKRLNTLYTPVLCNDIVKRISSNINNVSPADIIICKYESIKNSLIDYNKYNNIYLINDWTLTADFINKTAIDFDSINSIKGILGTPFLQQYTNKLIVDYIKFSKYRLDNMRISYKLDTFSQYDEYDTLKQQQYLKASAPISFNPAGNFISLTLVQYRKASSSICVTSAEIIIRVIPLQLAKAPFPIRVMGHCWNSCSNSKKNGIFISP